MWKKLINWNFFLRVLFFFLLIFAVFFLSVSLWIFIKRQQASTNLNSFYKLETETQTWLIHSKNGREDDEKAVQLLERLSRFSKSLDRYIIRNSFFYKGLIYWNQEDYPASATIFENLFTRSKNTLIGIKAGLGAAAAYENINNIEKAIRLYTQVSKQKKIGFFWEEASFHVARITAQINPEFALILYKKLYNELEDDNYWKSLTKNNILSLELTLQ